MRDETTLEGGAKVRETAHISMSLLDQRCPLMHQSTDVKAREARWCWRKDIHTGATNLNPMRTLTQKAPTWLKLGLTKPPMMTLSTAAVMIISMKTWSFMTQFTPISTTITITCAWCACVHACGALLTSERGACGAFQAITAWEEAGERIHQQKSSILLQGTAVYG